MIYSQRKLIIESLDGLLLKGSQLPESVPRLRKQISGPLGCSAWKCLRERTHTTHTRTYIYLFCFPKKFTPSTLGPRQSVSVPKCGTLWNPAGSLIHHSALRCPRFIRRFTTCSFCEIVSRSSSHIGMCLSLSRRIAAPRAILRTVDLQLETDLGDFSSPQSTSNMSESNKRRQFPSAPWWSQTTHDTSLSVNNDPSPSSTTSNSGYSSTSRRTSDSNWCNDSITSENLKNSKASEKNSEANVDSSSSLSMSSTGESDIRFGHRRSWSL
jgi:hypothetical protein